MARDCSTAPFEESTPLPRQNHQFAKRQLELAKKQKQEAKRLRKLERSKERPDADSPSEMPQDEGAPPE
jgi:hypothetical protein